MRTKAARRQRWRRCRSGSPAAPSARSSSSSALCVELPEGCSRCGCRSGPERCSSSGPTPGSRLWQLSCRRSRWDRPRSCKRWQFLLRPVEGRREAQRLGSGRTKMSRKRDKDFYLVGQAGPVFSVQLARFRTD